MKILLACERSAGHVFPALAMAQRLCARYGADCRITFFITADFFKQDIVERGYAVVGKSFSRRLLPVEMFWRFFESIGLLARLRPDKVIGFGGRDTVFLVLFARLFGAAAYIYDPNVVMGRANRFLAPFVKKIFTGFASLPSSDKAVAVGVPLRENIRPVERARALEHFGFSAEPVVLCFGGSQGSAFLNKLFLDTVPLLPGDYQIIHITGRREYLEISQRYNKINNRKFIRDFYPAMELAYGAADCVICRAGASTVGEIAFLKKPAIFVPLEAASGHQKSNAAYLSGRGAAAMVSQRDIGAQQLSSLTAEIARGRRGEDIRAGIKAIEIGVPFEDFFKDIAV